MPSLLLFKLSDCNVRDDGMMAIIKGCGNLCELDVRNKTGNTWVSTGNCMENEEVLWEIGRNLSLL